MAIVVSLRDVVDALEMSRHTSENIFDPETGEILLVTDDDHFALDEPDSEFIPDWQIEHLKKVRKVLNSGNILHLPNSSDINAWSLMEEYCYSVANIKQRDILLESIHGKGAFQRFREALERLALLDEWYSFRQSALQKIARDWLEAHNIPYKE